MPSLAQASSRGRAHLGGSGKGGQPRGGREAPRLRLGKAPTGQTETGREKERGSRRGGGGLHSRQEPSGHCWGQARARWGRGVLGALGGASCARRWGNPGAPRLLGQCPLCRPWARLRAALEPSGASVSLLVSFLPEALAGLPPSLPAPRSIILPTLSLVPPPVSPVPSSSLWLSAPCNPSPAPPRRLSGLRVRGSGGPQAVGTCWRALSC